MEESKVPPSVEYPLSSKYTLIIDGSIRYDDHFLFTVLATNTIQVIIVLIVIIRDQATNVLFEDIGDDRPIPTCIMESLVKVQCT